MITVVGFDIVMIMRDPLVTMIGSPYFRFLRTVRKVSSWLLSGANHPEFEEQATLKQSEYAEGYRPRTCKSVRYDLGHEKSCSKCQYWWLIKSPITIGDPRPLERSLTITNNCAVLIQADSSIVLKEPCLKALLIIQKVNPSAYERIRSVLSKAVWYNSSRNSDEEIP